MADELKPCPFCGGTNVKTFETSQDSDTQVQTQCLGCGAEIAFWLPWTASSADKIRAYKDTEARWNRRTPTSEGGE